MPASELRELFLAIEIKAIAYKLINSSETKVKIKSLALTKKQAPKDMVKAKN